MLSFERTELRRYSVWDQQDLELGGFQFEGDEKPSSGILLFYVSETAAAAVQQDLCQLCVKDEGSINTGKITGGLFCKCQHKTDIRTLQIQLEISKSFQLHNGLLY